MATSTIGSLPDFAAASANRRTRRGRTAEKQVKMGLGLMLDFNNPNCRGGISQVATQEETTHPDLPQDKGASFV